MNRNIDQTKALFEAWEALLRYRWRFILATFGVMTGVLVGGLMLPRKYKAEAIFERRTDMVLSEIVDRGGSKSFLDSQRASLVEEIAGQIALEDMITSLQNAEEHAHLIRDKDELALQQLRAGLGRRVTVRFDIGTKEFDRVRVSFIYKDRELASAIANTLVKNYIARTRRMIDARLEHTAGFFRSEVESNRKLIEELENKKLTFEIDHAELLPEFPGSIQLRLTETQRDLAELIQQRDTTAMRVKSLQHMIQSTPALVPQVVTSRNPQLTAMQERLAQLRQKLEQYHGAYKMTHKHPDVIAVMEQVSTVEQEIASTAEEVVTQKRLGANRKRDELDLQLSQATTSLQAKEREIESLNEMIARFNLHSTQLFPIRSDYRRLARTIEQAQRQQTFWEENLRRVQMALTAESGNRGVRLDFVKPSRNVIQPVSPNLLQIVMAAVVLGLSAGCVNVFLAHRTDDSFREGEQLAGSVGLPLMGTVSEIISRKQRLERRMRNLIIYPLNASAMAALLIIVTGLLYINLEKPYLYDRLKKDPSSFIRQKLRHTTKPGLTAGME